MDNGAVSVAVNYVTKRFALKEGWLRCNNMTERLEFFFTRKKAASTSSSALGRNGPSMTCRMLSKLGGGIPMAVFYEKEEEAGRSAAETSVPLAIIYADDADKRQKAFEKSEQRKLDETKEGVQEEKVT